MIEPINHIEETFRDLKAKNISVIQLFSGNPNAEGFQFPQEILKEVYGSYFSSQNYVPHPKGLFSARQAIAGYYERSGSAVNPEHILITSGTSESFFYLFTLLGKPGDNILVPHPSYPLFDHITHLTHLSLRPYPLEEDRNWEINVKELIRRADSRTRAVVLISPHNPTGAVASIDEIQEIVEWANQKELPLICDEVFSEFYFPSLPPLRLRGGQGELRPLRPIAISSPRLCFTLNGISKMFALPALKLGWIVVTGKNSRVEEVVDRLETTTDTFLSCHLPIQEALPQLFNVCFRTPVPRARWETGRRQDPFGTESILEAGRDFLDFYRREVGERRALALGLLRCHPKIRFVEPRGGFYLMVDLGQATSLSEEEFVIGLMKEKNVFIHPGFFYDYEKGVHGVISYLVEREKLKKGIEGLLEFL